MTRLPAATLRANLAAYLARATAGERIAITHRGRTIAVLGPPEVPVTDAALAQVARELGRRVGEIEVRAAAPTLIRCMCHNLFESMCPALVGDLALTDACPFCDAPPGTSCHEAGLPGRPLPQLHIARRRLAQSRIITGAAP